MRTLTNYFESLFDIDDDNPYQVGDIISFNGEISRVEKDCIYFIPQKDKEVTYKRHRVVDMGTEKFISEYVKFLKTLRIKKMWIQGDCEIGSSGILDFNNNELIFDEQCYISIDSQLVRSNKKCTIKNIKLHRSKNSVFKSVGLVIDNGAALQFENCDIVAPCIEYDAWEFPECKNCNIDVPYIVINITIQNIPNGMGEKLLNLRNRGNADDIAHTIIKDNISPKSISIRTKNYNYLLNYFHDQWYLLDKN